MKICNKTNFPFFLGILIGLVLSLFLNPMNVNAQGESAQSGEAAAASRRAPMPRGLRHRPRAEASPGRRVADARLFALPRDGLRYGVPDQRLSTSMRLLHCAAEGREAESGS